MGETLADAVDEHGDHERHLCALLGLDPNEVTQIRVVVDPGQRPRVEWTSIRRISLRKLVGALAPILDPVDPGPPYT
jgi:hypothetical protein